MRWTVDLDAAAFYFHLSEGTPARQSVLGAGIAVLDLDSDDQPVGLEFLASGMGLANVAEELAGLIDAKTLNGIEWVISQYPFGERVERGASVVTSVSLQPELV